MARVRYYLQHRVNMGDFEHKEYSLDILADNKDDYPGLTIPELIKAIKTDLLDGLADDIIDSSLDTAKAESFIHRHPLNQEEK